MRPDIPRENSVFVNVPYTPEFEPLFLVLVTAIVALGRIPRATLEVAGGRLRLNKIVTLIESCSVSIHELAPPPGDPRLNMPFELGIAVHYSLRNPTKHSFIVLEGERYRIQRTLSDLNGHDPYIHENTEAGMIRATLDALDSVTSPTPSATQIEELLTAVKGAVADLKEREAVASIVSTDVWKKAVAIAVGAAEAQGLIS